MTQQGRAEQMSSTLRRTFSFLISVAALTIVWITLSPSPDKVAGGGTGVAARDSMPAPGTRVSPHETTEIVTHAGRIAIEYGRPFKRGRKIWGGLVPWRQWWMPGADEATLLRTDHPIVLDVLPLSAGEYSLYMWVDPERPQLIVNRQVGQSHKEYNSVHDVGRVELIMADRSNAVEQLTFVLTEKGVKAGTLSLQWDKVTYSVAFESR